MRRWQSSLMTLTVLCILTLASSAIGSDRISINGYFKSFFTAYELPSVDLNGDALDLPPLGSVSNRVRLNGRWKISSDLAFSLSYDFAPRVQDPALFINAFEFTTINPYGYRFDDFDQRLYPSETDDVASFAIFQNLDRAMLEIHTHAADIYLGRQGIAFGSARVINPTDILAPYSYETLDTEDRVGIDAVRVRIPLSFMSEIDAGYVFGDDFKFENSAMFLRTKFYVARTDIAAIAVGFRENLMLGLDFTRSVGGAGVWLECAHTFTDALSDHDTDSRDYFRATLGADYSLGENTYGFAEYHFNQAGADDAKEYLERLTTTAYTDGSVYLLGRHYLIPGVSHQISPLLTGNLEILSNLSDWSVYLAPGLEYNIAENIYLAGGAYIGLGREPSLAETARSEFGTYPDLFYTSFRVYF